MAALLHDMKDLWCFGFVATFRNTISSVSTTTNIVVLCFEIELNRKCMNPGSELNQKCASRIMLGLNFAFFFVHSCSFHRSQFCSKCTAPMRCGLQPVENLCQKELLPQPLFVDKPAMLRNDPGKQLNFVEPTVGYISTPTPESFTHRSLYAAQNGSFHEGLEYLDVDEEDTPQLFYGSCSRGKNGPTGFSSQPYPGASSRLW